MNPNITWNMLQTFIQNRTADWWFISKNPNITFDIIQSNADESWNWGYNGLSNNKFENHPYFNTYKKKMAKLFHDTIYEELISKACHPRRVLNWMDEVNEPDCIYYGMNQDDINNLFS
jgi:hypothetical protein